MSRAGGQGGGGGVGSGRIVRRYHFHAPGVLYVAVTLFLALGADQQPEQPALRALGLAIGGLLVSGIISGASLLGLRVERDPIVHASVGAPAHRLVHHLQHEPVLPRLRAWA